MLKEEMFTECYGAGFSGVKEETDRKKRGRNK